MAPRDSNLYKRAATSPPATSSRSAKAARSGGNESASGYEKASKENEKPISRIQKRAQRIGDYKYDQLLNSTERVGITAETPAVANSKSWPALRNSYLTILGEPLQHVNTANNDGIFNPHRHVSKFQHLANYQALLRATHNEKNQYGIELKQLMVDAEETLLGRTTSEDYMKYIAETANQDAQGLEVLRKPSTHQRDRILALKALSRALELSLEQARKKKEAKKAQSKEQKSHWKKGKDTARTSRHRSPTPPTYSPLSDTSQAKNDNADVPEMPLGVDESEAAANSDKENEPAEIVDNSISKVPLVKYMSRTTLDKGKRRESAELRARRLLNERYGSSTSKNVGSSQNAEGINARAPAAQGAVIVSTQDDVISTEPRRAAENLRGPSTIRSETLSARTQLLTQVQDEVNLTRGELLRERASSAMLKARVVELEADYESRLGTKAVSRLDVPAVQATNQDGSVVFTPEHLNPDSRLMLQMYNHGR